MRRVGDHAGDRRVRDSYAKDQDDCTSLGFFLLAIVELATVGEGSFIRYQTIFGWGLFAVAAWVTMIFGVPFRLQYPRERVPRDLWNKPSFRQVHFRLSVAWAIIFTLDTILATIALGIGHRLLLVVIVPGASMVLGFLLTVLYPAYDHREFAAQMTKRSLPAGDSHFDGHDYA